MRYRVPGGQHRASRHLPHATRNDSELVITGEVPEPEAEGRRRRRTATSRSPAGDSLSWSGPGGVWGIATGAAACALLGGMPAATP
jgi:hypothetical protein